MKKSFLTGLALLLPLALTAFVIVFIVNFLTEPFLGITRSFLAFLGLNPNDAFISILSQIIVLLFLFFSVVFIGFCARMYLVNLLLKVSDFIILKIPFINSLYKASQEIIKTLFNSPKNSFKQVALVPYPHANSYTLGLVTGPGNEMCREKLQAELISVYIPTTPNPTSGYLLLFKKEDVIILDMKVDEALKYIISCGVLQENNAKLSSI
jgi:uncharacterized membrane protein